MAPVKKPETRARIPDDERHPAQADLRPGRPRRAAGRTTRSSATPGSIRSRAARTRRCTAASRGRCGCSPASARPRTPTGASSSCSTHGQTGLSTAFDMPTLMGYDPDHPRSLGEVGREGVSVASLDDMERLFADIPLDEVTTSMTINAPAVVLLAFYVARRRAAGHRRPTKLRGTLQNDMLKEFIAQKEWICADPRPHMRIIRDMLVYCTRDDAAVEHDLDQRLPHPRGGRDGGAGAGVHAGRRHRLRASSGVDAGLDVDDVRAAAVVLLGRPQRLLRGDREVPRRRAGCGRGSCASGSAPRTRARGCCARTRRPRACR